MSDRGREEVRPRNAPQDPALSACGDTGGEECRGRPVNGAVPATGDFMKRAKSEPTVRKPCIHLGNSERKDRFHASASTADPFNLRAQGRDGKRGLHVEILLFRRISKFLICSQLCRRVKVASLHAYAWGPQRLLQVGAMRGNRPMMHEAGDGESRSRYPLPFHKACRSSPAPVIARYSTAALVCGCTHTDFHVRRGTATSGWSTSIASRF